MEVELRFTGDIPDRIITGNVKNIICLKILEQEFVSYYAYDERQVTNDAQKALFFGKHLEEIARNIQIQAMVGKQTEIMMPNGKVIKTFPGIYETDKQENET